MGMQHDLNVCDEWRVDGSSRKGEGKPSEVPPAGPAPALQCIDFGGTPPSNHLPGADEKDQ